MSQQLSEVSIAFISTWHVRQKLISYPKVTHLQSDGAGIWT